MSNPDGTKKHSFRARKSTTHHGYQSRAWHREHRRELVWEARAARAQVSTQDRMDLAHALHAGMLTLALPRVKMPDFRDFMLAARARRERQERARK